MAGKLVVGGLCPLLQVFDMPKALAFYRDLLGFEVASPVPPDDRCDWVLLRHREWELMLNTAYEEGERPPTPDAARVEAHRDTALFFDCPDIEGAHAYLRERGVDASEPVVRDYGMKQLWFLDPDGYEICFQWPAS